MHRRAFLAGAAAALAACRRPHARRDAAPARVRAIAFDLFTIFDPRSIDAAVGDAELARAWKARAFEDCFVRAAAEQYVPFHDVVRGTLDQVLAVRDVAMPASRRDELVLAWSELAPWPDSAAVLEELRGRGFVLAPLANFSPPMIARLLDRAKLRPLFAHVLSTDLARSYKPARRAYQLGVAGFGMPASAIAFSAFGAWDAAGATWFGFPTCWVNRLGVAAQPLAQPAHVGPDLPALARWLAVR